MEQKFTKKKREVKSKYRRWKKGKESMTIWREEGN